MTRWAGSPLAREQIALFSPTVDSNIEEDHPVRVFEEILAALDWSSWENDYFEKTGQPAIHPRIIAATLLYGMSHGIRSSGWLEWARRNALDFIWLVEGRQIDHPTFCKFRNRFRKELKGVFPAVGEHRHDNGHGAAEPDSFGWHESTSELQSQECHGPDHC